MGEHLNLHLQFLSLALSVSVSLGQALFEAQQRILAMNLAPGAEAADCIQQQELAALAILNCAWDDCNERATMRCRWCHHVPYCSLEHRNLNVERHGVECRARGSAVQLGDEVRREPGQHR